MCAILAIECWFTIRSISRISIISVFNFCFTISRQIASRSLLFSMPIRSRDESLMRNKARPVISCYEKYDKCISWNLFTTHESKRIYLGKELQVIDILAIYSSKPLQDIRHCPQINWLWSSHFRSPVGLCCFLHHFIYCFSCQQLCIKQIQIKQL